MSSLGRYVKKVREGLHARHEGFSIRSLARRVGIHSSYLSKLERGEHAPLTEPRITALARELGEDRDVLMALAGKLPERLVRLIEDNPQGFVHVLHGIEEAAAPKATTGRLISRQRELEELNRRLRDEIRARQRMERRLVDQERDRRFVLDNLNDIHVVLLGADHVVQWVNSELSHHVGVTEDMAIGRKCHAAFHGRDTPCPDCTVSDAIRSRRAQDRIIGKRRGRYWLLRSVPVLDEGGVVQKVVHYAFDITRVKEIEHRQTLLSAIIENTQNICVIKDLDLRVIATNMAFAQAAGKQRVEDLIGRTDAEIFGIPPDQAPVCGYMQDERLAQTLGPGQVLDREEAVVTPAGVRYVHTRKFPVFDQAGNLMATANISMDVTEGIKAREALERAEKRFRDLFQNAPLPMASLDIHGRHLDVNAAYAALFGYASPQDMLRDQGAAENQYSLAAQRVPLMSMLAEGAAIESHPFRGKTRDGRTFTAIRTLRSVRGDDGLVCRFDEFLEVVKQHAETA